MSIFTKILEKLGLKKGESDQRNTGTTAQKPTATAGRRPTSSTPTANKPGPATVSGPGAPKPGPATVSGPGAPKAGPAAISEVDVVKQLETRAAGKGLNWKVSIVDLLKLLDIDSSREARNELAKELGAPADVMTDSARMNTWLHKAVLKKIAENGGNIPQSLLD